MNSSLVYCIRVDTFLQAAYRGGGRYRIRIPGLEKRETWGTPGFALSTFKGDLPYAGHPNDWHTISLYSRDLPGGKGTIPHEKDYAHLAFFHGHRLRPESFRWDLGLRCRRPRSHRK